MSLSVKFEYTLTGAVSLAFVSSYRFSVIWIRKHNINIQHNNPKILLLVFPSKGCHVRDGYSLTAFFRYKLSHNVLKFDFMLISMHHFIIILLLQCDKVFTYQLIWYWQCHIMSAWTLTKRGGKVLPCIINTTTRLYIKFNLNNITTQWFSSSQYLARHSKIST